MRASVSSVYRRRKPTAVATGRQTRLCLWHQYSAVCGSLGASRSKCAARRADRAARERITRSTSACSYSAISSRNASSSVIACGAYHARTYSLVARRRVRSESSRAQTSRSSPPSASTSYGAVFTPISRQLNAASSTPVASSPDSSAWTRVVPDPANGSRTCAPRSKYRSSSTSTSCGMNFPWYGCRRCTCFVRTCSGSARSDHESSRSSPAYSSSWVTATCRHGSSEREELLAKGDVRRRPREAGVRLLRVRRVLLDAGAVPERRLVTRVEDHVGPETVADREDERRAAPRTDDRVRRAGWTVKVVPRAQLHLMPLDDEQALAAQDEEALLIVLTVVHRHRLARLQHREVDAELGKALAVLVELARRAELILLPARLAHAAHPPAHATNSSLNGTATPGPNFAYAARASWSSSVDAPWRAASGSGGYDARPPPTRLPTASTSAGSSPAPTITWRTSTGQ